MTKIKDNIQITEEIKQAIINIGERLPDGRIKVYLGNCRLDFQTSYYLDGFTKLGVKLYWYNGLEEDGSKTKIKLIGKVYQENDYNPFPCHKLVTDGWNYIQRFYTESDVMKQKIMAVKA